MSKTTKKKRREHQAEVRRAQEARRNTSDYDEYLARNREIERRDAEQGRTYKWIFILTLVVVAVVVIMYFRGNFAFFG